MLKIYNIKDKKEFLKEICILTQNEWGSKCNSEEEFNKKIAKKMNKILNSLDNPYYCKLILVNENESDKNSMLIGFISIFPNDCEERKELTPWYATMFVKKEFRGNGYSKILNNAILKEAKKRDFRKIYLKTDLEGYYEKFGAKFIEKLENGEKLYYFDLV